MNQLSIAFIQADLAWEDPASNREYFTRKFNDLEPETDLVILPEMFTTGFTMNPGSVAEQMQGPTVEWLKSMASKYGVAVAGSIVIKEEGVYRNRFFFASPQGGIEHYDKRHSFTLAGEHEQYQHGKERKIINYKGWRIFPQICYDLRFPVFARNDVDYDLLIYVANWPEKRIDAWDALLKARAIENMSYCIGVNRIGTDANGYNYPGHSGAYDHLGNCVAFSEKEELCFFTLDKDKMMKTRNKLGFLNDRDRFTILPE